MYETNEYNVGICDRNLNIICNVCEFLFIVYQMLLLYLFLRPIFDIYTERKSSFHKLNIVVYVLCFVFFFCFYLIFCITRGNLWMGPCFFFDLFYLYHPYSQKKTHTHTHTKEHTHTHTHAHALSVLFVYCIFKYVWTKSQKKITWSN